jgi:hypothetical protein
MNVKFEEDSPGRRWAGHEFIFHASEKKLRGQTYR